jgi:tetratricopeptide (TPR) repeat protein
MKKNIVLVFLFLLGTGLVGSATVIDSLKNCKPKTYANKLTNFTELGWQYRNENLDSAFYWAMRGNKLIGKNTSQVLVSRNFHVLGALYALRGDYENSAKWFEKAYRLRKAGKDKKTLLETALNYAYTCEGLGNLKRMQPLSLEAEKLCIELKRENSKDYLTVLCQLNTINLGLRRLDKATEYLQRAVEAAEKAGNEYNMAIIYHNFGTFYLKIREFKKASTYFEKALPIIEKTGDKSWLTDVNFNLGVVYAENGELDKAEKIYIASYNEEKGKTPGNQDYQSISFSAKNLGCVFEKKKQYPKALKLLEESLQYAQKAGANDLLADRYMSISVLLEKLNRFKEALDYRIQYETIKDSLFGIETAKQLNELSAKFDTEKKEKKILLLKKRNTEIKLKQLQGKRDLTEEKAKSARRTILFVVLIVFVLLVAAFIYYSLVQKRKANVVLESKNEKIRVQHEMLEEKQKEIIDSINYAKRIQQSLLPSVKYIAKNIKKLQKNTDN